MDTNNNTATKDMSKNALAPGTMLKGARYTYTIKKVLGRGSFGITYQATIKLKGELGTITSKVALKEFYMGDINGREGSHVTSGNKEGMVQDYRKKFIREAKNLGDVNHENIINVLEVFEANGTVYYAMQYIEGGSLDDRIKKLGKLSESETIAMTIKMADALSALHKRGMLHLDIKPGNVMLTDDLTPILIDFGLSKHFDSDGAPESSTKIGAGTPGYAPVEQASYRVGKGIPVTMDVYALGATMFKMLTGRRPPEASVILNSIEDPADYLKEAGISPELTAIVVKAMSALIRHRYQTMDELLHALPGGDAVINHRGHADDEDAHDDVQIETPKASKQAKPAPKAAPKPAQRTEYIERAPDGTPIVEPTPMKQVTVEPQPMPKPQPPKPQPVASNPQPQPQPQQINEPDPNVVPEEYDDSPKKKLKLMPLLVGIVVGIAIVVGAILIFSGNKADDTHAEQTTIEADGAQATSVTDFDYVTPIGNVKYTGEVNSHNQPDGKGVAKFDNGSVYDGDWEDGVMQGHATYTLNNGDVYEGTWKNNAYDEGKYTVKEDGSYYVGKFNEQHVGYKGGGKWYDASGKEIPW